MNYSTHRGLTATRIASCPLRLGAAGGVASRKRGPADRHCGDRQGLGHSTALRAPIAFDRTAYRCWSEHAGWVVTLLVGGRLWGRPVAAPDAQVDVCDSLAATALA